MGKLERTLMVLPFIIIAVVLLNDERKKPDPVPEKLDLHQEITEVGVFDSIFMEDTRIISDPAGVSKDFRAFYERFNSDTAFQRKHVRFPLKGVCFTGFKSAVLWDPKNWESLNWNFTSMFDEYRYINVVAQSRKKFFYKCEVIDVGVVYEVGFQKIRNQWMLVYCMVDAY
jgi:hypothetical protein